MSEDNTQPIIVKKIKKGGHGAHGGAWKIAYADFVTAMMAFFLLMWLVGSTTKEEKAAIADFFNNPSAVPGGKGGASPSTVEVGGGRDMNFAAGTSKDGPNPNKTKPTISPPSTEVGEITKLDKQRLQALRDEVKASIESSASLKPYADQLLLEITKDGLRIQLMDRENRPMFASGSAILLPYAAQVLKEIGVLVNRVPNRISLSGHTDATPYTSATASYYSNWELSTDRANAARRALLDGGMDTDKVARVVGLSSAVLFDKQNPLNPANRRISIIVLNKDAEESLVHDEGRLDQTTEEASAPGKPATSEKTPDEPTPKPTVPSSLAIPVNPAKPPVTKPATTDSAPIQPKVSTTAPVVPPKIVANPKVVPKTPIAPIKPATPPGGIIKPIIPIAPIIAPLPLPEASPAARATAAAASAAAAVAEAKQSGKQ